MCLKRIHFNPAQISTNLTKLESDFIAKGGKWEKYKVGELFYINPTKEKFDANTLKFDGKYPYVARGEKNNGIRGYIDKDIAYLNEANTISFGQDTATMFYQPKAYFTGDKIKIFSPKNFILNQYIANFLIATLKRAFSNFSWGSSSYKVSVLKNIDIKLPTINGQIAFDFMESFIKELELERIKELEAYLQATGLNNYELTDKEKQTLDIFANSNSTQSLEWQEFKLGDLFDIDNTWIYGKNKQYKTRSQMPLLNSIPVISGITINNGVCCYTNDNLQSDEIFSHDLTISTRGEYSGTVTYHDENFALANNILVMQLPKQWNKLHKLYLATLISKLGYGGYSGYPKKETLKQDFIMLPINKNGQIDFEFMESFISAVQKEVIKSVVLWSEKRINATKEVIQKHA